MMSVITAPIMKMLVVEPTLERSVSICGRLILLCNTEFKPRVGSAGWLNVVITRVVARINTIRIKIINRYEGFIFLLAVLYHALFSI